MMNISNANTEPYRRYHDFHEYINIVLKVLSACAKHTMSHLGNSDTDCTLGQLIIDVDDSWRLPPIWEPMGETVSEMFGHISALGIVSSFSAIDDFTTGVEAEIARSRTYAGLPDVTGSSHSDFADQLRIVKVARLHEMSLDNLEHVILLLDYFRTIRNCISHRETRASTKLVRMSYSDELHEAYCSIERRPQDTLPRFSFGERITISPKLAIFYSHLNRVVAESINRQLVDMMGESGLLKMACYHVFERQHPVGTAASSTPQAVINDVLSARYLVRMSNGDEIIPLLRNAGLWAICRDGFRRHYGRNGSR